MYALSIEVRMSILFASLFSMSIYVDSTTIFLQVLDLSAVDYGKWHFAASSEVSFCGPFTGLCSCVSNLSSSSQILYMVGFASYSPANYFLRLRSF